MTPTAGTQRRAPGGTPDRDEAAQQSSQQMLEKAGAASVFRAS
eukprot:SAG22_NODE_11146_length_498_cov_1.283208_1_plen_42_part_10